MRKESWRSLLRAMICDYSWMTKWRKRKFGTKRIGAKGYREGDEGIREKAGREDVRVVE